MTLLRIPPPLSLLDPILFLPDAMGRLERENREEEEEAVGRDEKK